MSAPFSIQMSRARVITVAACFVAAGLLLFVAGTVTGLLVASSSVKALTDLAQSAATKPAIEPDKEPSAAPAPVSSDSAPAGASGDSNQTAPAASPAAAPASLPAPAAAPSSQPAASPAPSSPPAAAPAAAPAPASSAATTAIAQKDSTAAAPAAAEPAYDTTFAIPLAIKVCSFTGKASAEAMVTALAAKGYRASLGHSSGAGGRTWYVVKLGPYTEWNTASNVAARVAIAENVRPVIGPMR